MKVFKAYLFVIKRNIPIMLMYFAIFLGITLMITRFSGRDSLAGYEAERVEVAVVDRDGQGLAKGLIRYIGKFHNVKTMEDDKTKLQNELYYRNISYIVTIPQGFEQKYLIEGQPLEITKVPGSTAGFYVDQCIRDFLSKIRTYSGAGYTLEEAVASVLNQDMAPTEVTLLARSGTGGETPGFIYMLLYFPYLSIAVLCYTMSLVMNAFREPHIKRRMLSSPISFRRQNGESILAFLSVGSVFWLICMILPIAFYGKEFLTAPNLIWHLVNCFILMLASLSMAFLVGVVAKNQEVVNSIVNVLSLVMCFLGGIFVPAAMFGSKVKLVSQFLPTYWFQENLKILGENNFLAESMSQNIWKGYGLQLLFAIACVSVALVVNKCKEQEK